MLQGLFLVFSASVIFFNLVADLALRVSRPESANIVSTVAARDAPAGSPGQRRRRALGKGGRDYSRSGPA